MKNEVKYRIPDRWTKPFHFYDIVDINIANKNKPGIQQERGRVNKPARVEAKENVDQEVQLRIIKNAANSGTMALSSANSDVMSG